MGKSYRILNVVISRGDFDICGEEVEWGNNIEEIVDVLRDEMIEELLENGLGDGDWEVDGLRNGDYDNVYEFEGNKFGFVGGYDEGCKMIIELKRGSEFLRSYKNWNEDMWKEVERVVMEGFWEK